METSIMDASLSAEERAHLMELLRASEIDFFILIDGVSDAQWTAKPGPDRWSVQETAEHIVAGELGLMARTRQALASPARPDWDTATTRRTEFLESVLPNRSRRAKAPDGLHPRRGWTREETIKRFREARADTVQFVAQNTQSLKCHCAEHPFPVFGILNAYQWLLYIPLHNQRHNHQIAEILKEIAI